MEYTRILAVAAAALGIVGAIALVDAWWFLTGIIASGLLTLTGEEREGSD